jgi:hypothetical protein
LSAISQSLVEMTRLKTLWLQSKLLLFIYTAHDIFVCGFGGCDSCSCGRDDANHDNDADNNIFGGWY